MNTKGTVFKYPDNVDTDVIIPARYLNTADAKELAKHCMEDIDADYEALVIGKGYDHNWELKNDGKFMKVAELTSDNSGITMEVFTDRPGLQIYTANYVNNETGKHGVVYGENDGICFETQCFPNAINQKNFPSPICKKGEEFKSRTEYKFVV